MQLDVIKALMSMGLSLADTKEHSMISYLLTWSRVQPDASLIEFSRILLTEINDFKYHAYTLGLVWGFEGFWESLRSRIFLQGLVDIIEWEMVNPLVPLEMLSRGVIAPENLRKRYGRSGSNLQDFATQYLHTFLNSRASMEGWRLLAREIFVGATASEASSMVIIEILTSLWRRQFALQPFETWVRKALVMLLEDLAVAGVDLEEYMRWEAIRSYESSYESSYDSSDDSNDDYSDDDSDDCSYPQSYIGRWMVDHLRLRVGMRIPASGPALIIRATGHSPSDWTFSWDPCVEELSGEFLSDIEQPIPGAWSDFDLHIENPLADRCHMKYVFCEITRVVGSKSKLKENELLRVRGMATCQEMFPA